MGLALYTDTYSVDIFVSLEATNIELYEEISLLITIHTKESIDELELRNYRPRGLETVFITNMPTNAFITARKIMIRNLEANKTINIELKLLAVSTIETSSFVVEGICRKYRNGTYKEWKVKSEPIVYTIKSHKSIKETPSKNLPLKLLIDTSTHYLDEGDRFEVQLKLFSPSNTPEKYDIIIIKDLFSKISNFIKNINIVKKRDNVFIDLPTGDLIIRNALGK